MDTPSIKKQLLEAIKTAMRAGDKERLGVLRGASAAIKQREVDERVDLDSDDAAAIEVLSKVIKQCREAAQQYHAAGESERAAAEEREADIIGELLPEPASAQEVEETIEAAIANSGASSIKDMGRVMAQIKPQLLGRADLGAVSAQVKARLSGS
ncbi:glutamyl-tRNA amidotransferase [Halorhodospira abdelmalekii]|uniref:GatB/YqeY domain-containing protein n=1 Tax=Halorhodospira abdelmalekii TaxID=421629 RepID=UPI001908395F|nr:GatB/YqeY domain-containing protein [Halorhodospira abdelmalekii]MBK1735356.1 glutamyl-tRNA amidotransferase [Halorhodospira abdelmalekii]